MVNDTFVAIRPLSDQAILSGQISGIWKVNDLRLPGVLIWRYTSVSRLTNTCYGTAGSQADYIMLKLRCKAYC